MLDCVSANGHCYGLVIFESSIMVARSTLANHGLVLTTKRGLTAADIEKPSTFNLFESKREKWEHGWVA